MKKIISMLLVIALSAVVLTACSPADPKEALMKASQKSSTLNEMDGTLAMDITMTMAGQELKMPITGDIKYVKAEDKLEMLTNMNMELMGQKLDMAVYYKDGYMYTSAMDQKVKIATDIETATKQAMSVAPVESDMLKEVTTEKVDGGTKYIVTIDETKMNDYLTQVLGSTMGSAGMGVGTMNLSNMKDYYMVVNSEGYVTEQNISCDMTMNVNGGEAVGEVEVQATMALNLKVNNPGKPVTITAPADLDAYVEGTAPATAS